jgi:GNAT superfamily N-acetyltransferase
MELCKIQETDYSYVQNLLVEAFPPEERPKFDIMIEKADQGLADFWVIREENRAIGMAYILMVEDIAYLFYFAVDSTCRGKGYGTTAMKTIMEKYKDSKLLFSIEDWEEEADNTEQRIKRHQFYLRCGLIDLPFKLKGNGMIFAVMSNSDTIDSEKCRAVIEGIMGAPVGNMEIVPR